MADEIDLNEQEEAALERAWAKIDAEGLDKPKEEEPKEDEPKDDLKDLRAKYKHIRQLRKKYPEMF